MTNRTNSKVVWISAVTATFMIAQQIASKAVRDGFFLTQFEVTLLPVATLTAAVVSFAAALLLGKFLVSATPGKAVPILFAANGLLFGFEAALVSTFPKVVAGSLFLHIAALGAAVVSGFWSVINERFDPYTAKQVIGKVASGATLGGVLGGSLTWVFSDLPPQALMGAFAVGSFGCAIGIRLVAGTDTTKSTDEKRSEPAPLLAGLSVLKRSDYPRTIAILVFMIALMQGAIDYVFKAEVTASNPESLVGFFAVFYTTVGVITFLVQAGASQRVIKWIGVVPTVALFPAVTAALLGAALFYPSLAMLLILQGGAMVIENSLFRSGYELLYTAVPREQKRSAKMLIDLGSDRVGTAAASGVALVLIAVVTQSVDRTLLFVALVTALGVLGILVVVRRGYVASLAGQLRRNVDVVDVVPSETRLASTFVGEAHWWETFSNETSGGTQTILNRDDLLAAVQQRVDEKQAVVSASTLSTIDGVSVPSEKLLATPLRERLRLGPENDVEIQRSAPALIGQLGDILLSQREDVVVRLRAIELLSTVPSRRSAATLNEVLSEPELRLRRAGALALLKMCRVAPSLRPPRDFLSSLAVKELRRPSRPTASRTSFEESSPFKTDARGNEISTTLELVFLLLAIDGDSESLQLSLNAITSDDVQQRGTGLEYLENLLPGSIRSRLLALVVKPELTQADRSVSGDVVAELAEQYRDGEIDLRQLRRRYQNARKAKYDKPNA